MTQLGISAALVHGEQVAEPWGIVQADGVAAVHHLMHEQDVKLVIVDPTEPTLGAGLALCRDLSAGRQPPSILAFCGPLSDRELMFCQLAGIDSFVCSQEAPSRLVEAVDATFRGGRVWFLGRKPAGDWAAGNYQDVLTPREQEVLWRLAERYTNEQIARELTISRNTVKNHVASVLRKLGVRQRSDLFGANGYVASKR